MSQLDMFSSRDMPVPGLRYVAEFVDAARELALLAEVDSRPWLADLKRRVQHYGYKYDYKARAIDRSMFVGPLPAFGVEVARALVEARLLEEPPDQMIVNEYLPGQGISAHVDCEPCFEDRIVTVSLGSRCEMEFLPKDRTRPSAAVLLEPRSALLLSGEARSAWQHMIRGRRTDHGVPRTRRVSLTFRRVVVR